MTTSGVSLQELAAKVDQLSSIPSVGAIIQPLLSYFALPCEQQNMQRIVDLVSHDNALTAQCLRMANSPLYGRHQTVTSTRAAVVALGLQRMRDIVLSCCLVSLSGSGFGEINPTVFWEHSLACGLVARKMAKRLGARDPEGAYLAGLLHDIGFVVNLQLIPDLFSIAVRQSRQRLCGIEELESKVLGFTHCQTGELLAQRWDLNDSVRQAIVQHHHPTQSSEHVSIVALISLSDELCRRHGLGYGYDEVPPPSSMDECVELLKKEYPLAKTIDWTQMNLELTEYLKDARKLISVLFRLS